MKIRTSDNLMCFLDGEISWRHKEIIQLQRLALSAKEKKADVHVRAGIALLYAHWEGFVKCSSNAYIEYLGFIKEKMSNHQDCFIAMSLKYKIGDMGAAKSSVAVPNIQAFIAMLDQPIALPKNGISTESNLNSEVFSNIAGWLGIDCARYSARFALIDESLLAARNKIAHGEYIVQTPKSFDTLAREIVELMTWFKTDIENAVARKSYLKAS